MTNIFLVFSSILSCILIFILLIIVSALSVKRSIKGKTYILVLIAALFLWTLIFIIRSSIENTDVISILMHLENLPIATVPVCYYFIYKNLIMKKDIRLYELIVLPLILTAFIIIVFINPGRLYYKSIDFVQDGGNLNVVVGYDILFYLFIGIIILSIVFISLLVAVNSIKNKQMTSMCLLIAVAILVPLTTSFLYVFKVTPQDYTCPILSIAAMILLVFVYHNGVFESHVYIKRHLFDMIEEPLLIINRENRVSHINAAAEKLMLKKQSECFNKSIFELFPGSELKEKDITVFQKNIHFPMREPMELRFRTVNVFSNEKNSNEKLLIVNNVTQIHEMEKQLEYLLEHDAVTGLYNANKMNLVLEEFAASHSGGLSGSFLCCITIANMETLNRILTKEQKNKLYSAAAGYIEKSSKKPFVLARQEENEFCLFSNNAGIELEDFVKCLSERSKTNIEIDGELIQVEFKCGVYLVEEKVGAKKALRNASYALRSSTFSTQCNVKIYDKMLKLQHNLQIGVLEKTIIPNFRNDFQLVFQPIIDRNSDSIIGAEVFTRWHHPSLGVIQPNVFVPVLEDAKLISEFGDCIINKIVAAMKVVQEKMGKNFFLSMNMSKRQLFDLSFADKLKAKIASEEVDASSFIMEIKEPHIACETDVALRFAEKAAAQGIGTAIDNFGWGNSCVSHIVDLKCVMAKLNTTFSTAVQNSPNKAAVVQYMVDLAKKLNIRLVAVHVETQKDLHSFEEMGIRLFQGLIFSAPLGLDEFFKYCDLKGAASQRRLIAAT